MKHTTRADGKVRIRLPDSASVVTDVGSTTRGGSRSTRRADSGAGSNAELSTILDALSDDDSPISSSLSVVDSFQVDVGSGTSRPTTRSSGSSKPDKEELDINLDLQTGESAVVLIEQDDTYEWHYPALHQSSAQRADTRSTTRIGEPQETLLTFRIPIGDDGRLPRPANTNTRGHRGPITSFIKGKIQGFILKFVARKTIGALTRRLERGVTEGPVVINHATDAMQWSRSATYPTAGLPVDRARRVLLMVHGTFSSTVGSFGALTIFDQGQMMLTEALKKYDLVIGFDHYTLSETPDQNAEAMLAALLPLIEDGHSLEIDAISFSRGGLVFRYFSEILVPAMKGFIVCRKSVFVGCTNSGTELANDDNWKHLIDFYTNMIAGATRLIGMAPGAALPTRILRQSIKAIGSMVTYIAQDSVANNSVPGVAAMEPAGDFINALNAQPPTRTTPGARFYYAIGSNFEPVDNDAFKLGKRLVLKAADGFVDKLMGKANDLVVNNDSMFVIDPVRGARMVEQRSVDANGRIYHTVYFHQTMVASLCAQWLDLVDSAPAVRGLAHRAQTENSLPRTWWSDAVSREFVLLSFISAIKEAQKRLKTEAVPLVVLQRVHEGQLLFYGFTRKGLLTAMKGTSDRHARLGDVLGLHEWQSRSMSIEDAMLTGSPSALRTAADALAPQQGFPGADLAVVLENEKPVGVVRPIQTDDTTAFDNALAGMLSFESNASRSSHRTTGTPRTGDAPSAPVEGATNKRSARKPRMTTGGAQLERAPAAHHTGSAGQGNTLAEPERIWCHMHASMAEEVPVESTTTLEVTISRDLIARETGISGEGQVEPDRPLIIQAMARKHCDIEGSDRLEIDIPGPGAETPLLFDIKALHTGIGEVDIYARQGNQPIIHLKLRPRFIKRNASPNSRNTTVTATLQPVSPRQEIADVLYIYDVQVGSERILEFNIQSRKAGLQGRYRSEPFKNDNARLDYITNLYEEIEAFWADDDNDYDAFMEHLMARGANLYDKLVPVEIQQRLWKARNTLQAIQVISDEPFIPWELLYLKQPGKPAKPDSCFLVEKGMLRWVSNMGFAPTHIRLRDNHFKFVVPKYPESSGHALPGAQAEAKMLKKKFGATAIKPDSKSVKKVLSTPGTADILHFACHGLADPESIWNSGLMMQGKMQDGEYKKDNLNNEWTSTFADLRDESGGAPMVFLNACQIGRQGYNLTGTGGFAQAFVRAGASAFIGSHWSVGDAPAVAFSQTLYTELLENGATMMDAVSKARQAAKNNKEVTWLAYAVYADPYARIVHQ